MWEQKKKDADRAPKKPVKATSPPRRDGSEREDFNKLRLISKALVKTMFKEGWQFQMRIQGAPKDFDIYVKDMTFGPIEIETEPVKAGMQTLTFPSGTGPVGVAMTMRDHQDQRIYKWFEKWAGAMVNEDGTVNLPKDYLRKCERIALISEKVIDTWFMFPTRMGDINESVETPGFLEVPVSLLQFRSWGEKDIRSSGINYATLYS